MRWADGWLFQDTARAGRGRQSSPAVFFFPSRKRRILWGRARPGPGEEASPLESGMSPPPSEPTPAAPFDRGALAAEVAEGRLASDGERT